MGSAYVPGLKVTELTTLRMERRLPLKGEVVVKAGDQVQWDQVVARTFLPGSVDLVNVGAKLGIEPAEVPTAMLKQIGQSVQKGEPMARNKGFFGIFKSTLEAPMTGTVEDVNAVTGQVVLRAPAQPVQITAYVDGTVDEVLADEGVVIRTYGSYIQGIFGIGGETAGELVFVSDDPAHEMKGAEVQPAHRDRILVGGSLVTAEVLAAAVKMGVRGIIVGGIHDRDLRDFLGYDLGVAITGNEEKGLTLVITEGFGPIRMADRTWKLLHENAGRRASISGATQIRAGVIRPEVIIPHLEKTPSDAAGAGAAGMGFDVGAPVRIIREPHFGSLARVVGLPVELTVIPTGARVRVADIELEDGSRMTIPRANLELIELV